MNIESVLSQLKEIESSIDSLIENMSEHDCDELASELEQISYDVTGVKSDITDINEELKDIEDKVYDLRF